MAISEEVLDEFPSMPHKVHRMTDVEEQRSFFKPQISVNQSHSRYEDQNESQLVNKNLLLAMGGADTNPNAVRTSQPGMGVVHRTETSKYTLDITR